MRLNGFHSDRLRLVAPALLPALLLLAGCATSRLEDARTCFYAGQFEAATGKLSPLPGGETDRVLFLMERGNASQAAGRYQDSIRDWLEAAQISEDLDYLSLSRGSSSLVINDRVQRFRGAPYERVLMRAFAAQSYLALGQWDDAAVEARNIVKGLENLDGFPDDPYSRYLAAFCFAMIGDGDGAALEYRNAGKLLPGLRVDERTGAIAAVATNALPPAAAVRADAAGAELVCFIGIGRATWSGGEYWGTMPPYAEVYANGRYLGRSYPFADTDQLATATEKRMAALKAAKTGARVATKEVIAHQISERNDLLGALSWLLLFALETPDTRRWETLPRHLEVARVPCPADLKEYTLVFKGCAGTPLGQRTLQAPLSRRGRTFVSFCREL